MTLKFLGDFWRSIEMPLINCNLELKHNRTKDCVLSAGGKNNGNGNDNNIILLLKTQNYTFLL